MDDKTPLVRALNDALRRTFIGGRIVMTVGVQSLAEDVKSRVLSAAREFGDFNEDNDPHGEHDFGSFELDGQSFFWKIDYYDKDEVYGSEEPSDPTKTSRVLTIMLAEEY